MLIREAGVDPKFLHFQQEARAQHVEIILI